MPASLLPGHFLNIAHDTRHMLTSRWPEHNSVAILMAKETGILFYSSQPHTQLKTTISFNMDEMNNRY